ncbi:MAG TPA: acyl-CoA dehydrogenase family protein, partial [Chloroflexota bacterium]
MAETTTRAAGTDYYQIDDLLTEDERALRERVRTFCDREVLPVINRYWEAAEFPHELVPKLAALGLCGGTIAGYGCPGLSAVAAGLLAQELARGDGSLNTFFGVQSGLVMQSIYLLGSEEQRQRWLPRLASFEAIGAFALTEPRHGTDAVMLETRARREGDGYVL